MLSLGLNIFIESCRMIEQVQMCFITHILKIKFNTPYLILLIEVSLSPIESMAMTTYLIYKNKVNDMGDTRIPKMYSYSIQNHLLIKRGWHKDAKSWLNGDSMKRWLYTLVISYNIESIITSRFKEKMWCDKALKDKRNLRYYNEVINPNL